MTFENNRKLFRLEWESVNAGIIALALIAIIWSIEQFLVQGATLTPDMAIGEMRQLKREAVRFLINLSFASFLVFILPKRILLILFGLSCLMDSGLIAYHRYFHQPLSHFTLTSHLNESVEVAGAFADYFPAKIFLLLGAGMIIKGVLLFQVKRVEKRAKLVDRKIGLVSGVAYLIAVFLLVFYIRPMGELKSWKSTSWFGGIYGYGITWLGESYYLGSNASLLQYANAVSEPEREPRPSPISHLDFIGNNHIVVVQCESLSYWASTNMVQEGRQLMPFLNELREASLVIRIEPIHRVGSSDADFCFLTSKFPNGKVTPYKIVGFDYSNALPFLIGKSGYTSHFFHGNRGTFFARREPCQSMGFDDVSFQEELEARGLPRSKWGVFDHDVFSTSSSLLNAAIQPTFHFIISLTTHSPFNFLPAEYASEIHKDSDKLNRYYNSMRYLDDCLNKYYSQLPNGTWLILYGDHGPGFRKEESGLSERVPFIVARKNFRVKQSILYDFNADQFDLLDMSKFFRAELKENVP